MAFIDDFNKLVVENGQQKKIANKDKAIIDLANEVANGGNKLSELKSIWHYSGQSETYTKLSSVTPIGNKPQQYNANFDYETDCLYLSKSDSDTYNEDDNLGKIIYLRTKSAGVIASRGISIEFHENFKFNSFYEGTYAELSDLHEPNSPNMNMSIWTTGTMKDSDPDINIAINTSNLTDPV